MKERQGSLMLKGKRQGGLMLRVGGETSLSYVQELLGDKVRYAPGEQRQRGQMLSALSSGLIGPCSRPG